MEWQHQQVQNPSIAPTQSPVPVSSSLAGGVVVSTAQLGIARPIYSEGLRTTDEFLAHVNCKDIEKGMTKRVRHKHRPFYRRVYNYLREAWIGVKNAKSGIYQLFINYFCFQFYSF